MIEEKQAITLLNDFINDVLADRPPHIYQRMAASVGMDIDSFMAILPLFELARGMAAMKQPPVASPQTLRERILQELALRKSHNGFHKENPRRW